MELTQLEYFLAAARMEHLTNAAEALSITQPALSHSISKLEAELGVPLFERKGRNLKINRYGTMFAKHVERILNEVERGKKEIEEIAHPDSGVIHLSYLNILGTDLIPRLIREYRNIKPNISFRLLQGDKGAVLEQVEDGHSDLMITSERPVSDAYQWVPIRSLPLYLVVAKDSLLTRVHHANFTLAPAYDAEDLPTVAGFVSSGLGISVLPRTAGLNLEGLRWIEIGDEGWVWEVGLHLKKDRPLTRAAQQFVDFIQEKAERLP